MIKKYEIVKNLVLELSHVNPMPGYNVVINNLHPRILFFPKTVETVDVR